MKDEVWDKYDQANINCMLKLRESIKNIVKYINDNDGWTYIGWLRTGRVTDQSASTEQAAGENLSSVTQTPHLSYLYPSNLDKVN